MRLKKTKYIGVIPAAGNASRLKNLNYSKEIHPLNFRNISGEEICLPVSQCLINAYRKSGISDIKIIIKKGKEDICRKLGNGMDFNVQLNYMYTDFTYGPAYTINQAFESYRDSHVALGFPDIVFKPHNAYRDLIHKQLVTGTDVVLGLFRSPNPQKMDMVEISKSNAIANIDIKPKQTKLVWTWIIAVWNPSFSFFMNNYLDKVESKYQSNTLQECHVGTVFKEALESGINFDFVFFDNGEIIDIGTPDDMQEAKAKFICEDWSEILP